MAWQSQSNPSVVPLLLWGADGLIGYRWVDASGTSRARYFTYNLHGDLTQALDEAGNIAEIGAFNAHGAPLKDGNGVLAVAGMFGYGAKFGYVRDGESGFYLCGFRYYDPSAGRWITRDPIGYDGGQNLYGYVDNDPVNLVDPDGLNPWLRAAIQAAQAASRVGPAIGRAGQAVANGASRAGQGIANAASRAGQWFGRNPALTLSRPYATNRQMVLGIRQLEAGFKDIPGTQLPLSHQLTNLQRQALLQNVQSVINITIARCKETGRFESVRNQLANPRFRFLDQVPEAKQALQKSLEGTGVTIPW